MGVGGAPEVEVHELEKVAQGAGELAGTLLVQTIVAAGHAKYQHEQGSVRRGMYEWYGSCG